jgi:hypothetical protein
VQQITVGSVVSRIWEIYRSQPRVLIGTALSLYGLELIVQLLIPGAGISIGILFWALGILYQGMVVKLVQDVQDGRREHSVADLLRSVEPVLLPLIGVSILFALGLLVGFLLFIIPGLFLLVIWAVVAPVTVLEQPGVLRAFGRSRELVRGHGWSVFGVIMLVVVAVLVVSLLVTILSLGLGSVGSALVQWVVSAAVAPVFALSASVLYFALRDSASHDGWAN